MSRRLPLSSLALFLMLSACAHAPPAASPAPAAPSPNAHASASAVTRKQDVAGSIAPWTPVRGASTALVTIVEFGDFQCPFCRRAHVTINELRRSYGDKLRVAFRNLPLPFHPHAARAAEAAMAAAAQGKFGEMADRLYAENSELDDASLREMAVASGLDMSAYDAALADGRYQEPVEIDRAHAAALDIKGTPTFIINGRLLRGNQPAESFRAAIDAELKTAEDMLAAGAPRDHLYDLRIAVQDPTPPPEKANDRPSRPALGPRRAQLAAWTPERGRKTAKVTIVEYTDFQCPYCGRAATTIDALRKRYGDELRIALRHNPLPFHVNARAYAELSMAAKDQGKFWEVHDFLFAHQSELDELGNDGPSRAFEVARKVGLDLRLYRQVIAAQTHAREIDADIAEAQRLGATGTPSFFVNGQPVTGAQPIEAFITVIDAELKKAQDVLGHGVRREDLYDKTLAALPDEAPK